MWLKLSRRDELQHRVVACAPRAWPPRQASGLWQERGPGGCASRRSVTASHSGGVCAPPSPFVGLKVLCCERFEAAAPMLFLTAVSARGTCVGVSRRSPPGSSSSVGGLLPYQLGRSNPSCAANSRSVCYPLARPCALVLATGPPGAVGRSRRAYHVRASRSDEHLRCAGCNSVPAEGARQPQNRLARIAIALGVLPALSARQGNRLLNDIPKPRLSSEHLDRWRFY